ncbi:recombinase family protein [Parasphingorhabdus sp.]|uniref:recombinase family protein n=1 Tax=Parasphingorhabdus sp. TaxID=2709688 RepID=UPI003D296F7C
MLVGYARTSTVEQEAGLENQQSALLATGCMKVFAEQVSSVAVREQFDLALDFVRDGDVLVATRLDRLARSTSDFLKIIDQLDAKQVGLRILDFGGSEIDTKSATGRMMMTMFAAFAEFERSLLLERQRIGIAKAKAEGKYKGRAPTARAKTVEIIRLKDDGLGASDIAKETGISRASVYRILADAA